MYELKYMEMERNTVQSKFANINNLKENLSTNQNIDSTHKTILIFLSFKIKPRSQEFKTEDKAMNHWTEIWNYE